MKLYNEIIRDLREDREPKTNQEEIAKVLKITRQQYQLYESGKRKLPLEHLKTLCMFYNVSADYILDLPDNLPYPKR